MDQNEQLKEILDSDYKLILISGEYFDCPSCNDTTSFITTNFWGEADLLKHILKHVGGDRMEAIWVLDSYSGNMLKYCDIETSTGHHNVTKLKFRLPEKGLIVIHKDDKGGWVVADDAWLLLYEKDL